MARQVFAHLLWCCGFGNMAIAILLSLKLISLNDSPKSGEIFFWGLACYAFWFLLTDNKK